MGSLKMNREEEKVCVKWSDFQENAISSFGILREDRELNDVTLACEDGQQIEAHKVILASSSPFFLNLLRRNKHPHTLVYMRGLKSEDLVAMLDFLYYGEANVSQENLDSFLAVAEELQLKGLMGFGAENKVKEKAYLLTKNIPPKPVRQRNQINQKTSIPDSSTKVETNPPTEGAVAVTDVAVAADLQDLDAKIKSMMGVNADVTIEKRKAKICKVCGKVGARKLIRNHIEAKHITGVSQSCNICGYVAKTRNSISSHKSLIHRQSGNPISMKYFD